VKCETISFTSAAMPNRKAAVRAKNAQEYDLDKNLSAYKRLRESGVNPASTAQAANVERFSDTKHEIESGKRFGNPKVAKQVERMLADTPQPTLPNGMMAK
jgi:hypothetical protein